MTQLGSGVERLHELLIKRALWGIDTGESRELAHLGAQYPDEDLEAIDSTVAMLDAIELGPTPSMPASVRAAVMAESPAAPSASHTPASQPLPASRLPWVIAAACAALAAYALLRCGGAGV